MATIIWNIRFNIVSNHHKYLKDRGVICSGFRKEDRMYCVIDQRRVGLEFDPEGLLECRADMTANRRN